MRGRGGRDWRLLTWHFDSLLGKHFSGVQLCMFLGTGFNFAYFWVQLFLLFTLSPCAPRRDALIHVAAS
jgi:hypothetical protein